MRAVTEFLFHELLALVQDSEDGLMRAPDTEDGSEASSEWSELAVASGVPQIGLTPRIVLVCHTDTKDRILTIADRAYCIDAYVNVRLLEEIKEKHEYRSLSQLRGSVIRIDEYEYCVPARCISKDKAKGGADVPQRSISAPTHRWNNGKRVQLWISKMSVLDNNDLAFARNPDVYETGLIARQLEMLPIDELDARMMRRQGVVVTPLAVGKDSNEAGNEHNQQQRVIVDATEDEHPLLAEDVDIPEDQQRQLDAQEGWDEEITPTEKTDSQLIEENGSVPDSQEHAFVQENIQQTYMQCSETEDESESEDRTQPPTTQASQDPSPPKASEATATHLNNAEIDLTKDETDADSQPVRKARAGPHTRSTSSQVLASSQTSNTSQNKRGRINRGHRPVTRSHGVKQVPCPQGDVEVIDVDECDTKSPKDHTELRETIDSIEVEGELNVEDHDREPLTQLPDSERELAFTEYSQLATQSSASTGTRDAHHFEDAQRELDSSHPTADSQKPDSFIHLKDVHDDIDGWGTQAQDSSMPLQPADGDSNTQTQTEPTLQKTLRASADDSMGSSIVGESPDEVSDSIPPRSQERRKPATKSSNRPLPAASHLSASSASSHSHEFNGMESSGTPTQLSTPQQSRSSQSEKRHASLGQPSKLNASATDESGSLTRLSVPSMAPKSKMSGVRKRVIKRPRPNATPVDRLLQLTPHKSTQSKTPEQTPAPSSTPKRPRASPSVPMSIRLRTPGSDRSTRRKLIPGDAAQASASRSTAPTAPPVRASQKYAHLFPPLRMDAVKQFLMDNSAGPGARRQVHSI